MYIFIITTGSSRCNIHADFEVLDVDQISKEIKKSIKPHDTPMIRYAKVGGGACLLKNMRIDEFEKVFKGNDFTSDQITRYFRKEISEKYGTHAEMNRIKRIPKKLMIPGHIYENDRRDNYLYLGKGEYDLFDFRGDGYWSTGSKSTYKEGYLYIYVGSHIDKRYFDYICNKRGFSGGDETNKQGDYLKSPECTKMLRKFIKDTGFVVELSKTINVSSYRGDKLSITLKDL